MNVKMVGIACGCKKLNYGSLLQSFALCEAIKELGYDCHFVWLKGSVFKYYNIRLGKIAGVFFNAIKHPSIVPKVVRSVRRVSSKKSSYAISNENKRLFSRFIKENFHIKLYSWNELRSKEKNYYKFVCGSDQIWNSYEYYLDPMYFLRFTSRNKRIAYAPSFGVDSVSYYNRAILKKYISEFDALSVREVSGGKICRELTGREPAVVADPTFLLTKEQWKEILGLKTQNQEYCLVYFLSYPNSDAIEMIDKMRKILAIKAIPMDFDCYMPEEIVEAGPKEFLELLMNAKYIITDSFHGTIFSINFEKQFVCFERQYASGIKQSSRITDILAKFGLEDRYITESRNLFDITQKTIEYELINNEEKNFREESFHFLLTSLDS